MLYRSTIILLISIYSCSQANKLSHAFFKDVDINTIQGLEKTTSNQFPNIEIFDSSGLKVLLYHIDEKKFFKRIYRHEKDTWVTKFSYKNDTATIFTIRVVYPDNLLEFSYTDTTQYPLFDAGILKNDTMRFYNPTKEFFVKPLPENLESIKENSMYQTTYTFDSSADLTRIIQVSKIKEMTEETNYIECYPKNGRSFFWWLECKDYIDHLPCITP